MPLNELGIHRIFSPAVYFFFSYVVMARENSLSDHEGEGGNTIRRGGRAGTRMKTPRERKTRKDTGCFARVKSEHGRRKTESARVTRFIYCVRCNSTVVRGRPQIDSCLHPELYYAFVTARAEYFLCRTFYAKLRFVSWTATHECAKKKIIFALKMNTRALAQPEP